jgi:hypothetical protein
LRVKALSVLKTKLPFIKIHHVFNVGQFSNVQTGESLQTEINNTLLNETEGKGNINTNPERILEGCEKVLSSWECKINLVPGSDRCFYSPLEDFIQLIDRPQFKNNEFFYATMLHEVSHSSGHEIRTGRIKKFNESYKDHKQAYAIEELVAEISSAFIMASNNFYYSLSNLFSGLFITDGLKYVTDKLGLHWFIDTVLSYQGNEEVKAITFQIWTLERITAEEKAGQWRVVLYLDNIPVIKQLFSTISLEDNYEDKFEIFKIYLADNVLFLPSED